MTTSVTDDRQDDFETWYADHYQTTKPIRRSPEGMKKHCPDLHYNSYQENMAYAAWKAALRSQGKVPPPIVHLNECRARGWEDGALAYRSGWNDCRRAALGEEPLGYAGCHELARSVGVKS
jgi:hypothetical protein